MPDHQHHQSPIQSDSLSPIEALDRSDPGDDTQRAFRYQHAYGVILLLAGFTGEKPYSAVWCEHHEDIFCERSDQRFDGFQIKTRKPENGHWTLSDESLKKSIKRFTKLFNEYENHINDLSFVSNTDFLKVGLDVKDRKRLGKSPVAFLQAVASSYSFQDLVEPFDKSFNELQDYCDCGVDLLFKTLKKIRLVMGPDLRSFDAEISHNHLPRAKGCENLDRSSLNQLRDELIQKVYYASSLYSDHPSRHWQCLLSNNAQNPELLAKKLKVEIVSECLQEYKSVPFRYSSGLAQMNIHSVNGEYTRLQKKFARGGLAHQFLTMQRRTLSTENILIELSYSSPEKFGKILNQLECVVKGECDEARLKASLEGSPYGERMLCDVYQRLKWLSREESSKVEYQNYECLVGMAGLLTEDCKVWWSEEFDLGVVA